MKKWSLVLLVFISLSVPLDNTAIAREEKASTEQKENVLVPFDIKPAGKKFPLAITDIKTLASLIPAACLLR